MPVSKRSSGYDKALRTNAYVDKLEAEVKGLQGLAEAVRVWAHTPPGPGRDGPLFAAFDKDRTVNQCAKGYCRNQPACPSGMCRPPTPEKDR